MAPRHHSSPPLTGSRSRHNHRSAFPGKRKAACLPASAYGGAEKRERSAHVEKAREDPKLPIITDKLRTGYEAPLFAVTLQVSSTDIASNGLPVTLPDDVKLKIRWFS